MASTFEKILEETNLSAFFEETKEQMVETVWTYIQGYQFYTDTEPIADTVRIFIRETIKYMPKVTDFYALFDAPKETKESTLRYLVDKFYDYVKIKLLELDRIISI